MDEFGFDDGFDELADFDLDAAVASARKAPRPSPSSAQNAHPNVLSSSPNAFSPAAAFSPAKRPPSFNAIPSKRIRAALGDDGVCGEDPLGNEPSAVSPRFEAAVTSTLRSHFGHAAFRPGQLSVLRSLLGEDGDGRGGRDACVFWATGAGKSLCYQLPPVHLGQVAVVVSPLISLMEDQVSKLNGRGGADVAAFLGSSQADYSVEERALGGAYPLVYATPEKLTSGNFLERLAAMHSHSAKICLIAVDESHCVSEWGHDFRTSFLEIGSSLRGHSVLSSIPLLALTATAVPRVQQDILRSLRMRPDATVHKRSFDRTNLKIAIRRRPWGGARGAIEPMAEEMAKAIVRHGVTHSASRGAVAGMSTIIYCSTRNDVEDITSKFTQGLAHHLIQQHTIDGGGDGPVTPEAASQLASSFVKPYHAGLSFGERSDAHTDFLVGKVAVIVATVAFGMGIDKPDIRRVVHWGACKTVEEYYQQMGRAGRDGLAAECTMYADLQDFVKYKDDFYLGGLSGEARAATLRSMDALRDFAMSTDGCRRAALLRFFDETPAFGEYCGTCDLCLNRKHHGNDLERDFQWEGARVVLFAVQACPDQAMSTIETIIKGGTADSYRYHVSLRRDPSRVTLKIESLKEKMKRKKPIDYFKDFIPSLVNCGYLKQETRKNTYHQYAKPYSVYDLTPKGRAVLTEGPIRLPVPASVREQERLEEEKKQRTLAELKDKGADLQQIPQEELEVGDGEAIAALKRWYSYVDSLASRGKMDMVNRMDDLKNRIEAWRMDTAEMCRMAPASVLEEHMLLKVAYATASLRAGARMDKDALVAAGVRSNGIDELTAALGEWVDENIAVDGGDSDVDDQPMALTPGEPLQPANSWRFAVYKPNKKTGKAVWELSYERFVGGDHPQTIAMIQKTGRPIQVATVVGHILEALTQGRPVDLHRLSLAEVPPTRSEWQELVRCSVETGIDVTADPATCGPNGERFIMKDFLVPIMGNEFCVKDFKERTEEESVKWSRWCGLLKWYLALRRVGVQEPLFGNSK